MPENAHDPPTHIPVNVLPGYVPEAPFTAEQLAALRVPRHATYALMRAQLGTEPMELIRLMKHGGFRFKCKRGYPGTLSIRYGSPVPERMSFRKIAPLLSSMSGVQVTYETVRRWWEAVVPDEPDEPADDDTGSELPPVPMVQPTARAARRVTRRRTPTPTAGDEHAEAIRAATERAKSTNPTVPAAAFLSPGQ